MLSSQCSSIAGVKQDWPIRSCPWSTACNRRTSSVSCWPRCTCHEHAAAAPSSPPPIHTHTLTSFKHLYMCKTKNSVHSQPCDKNFSVTTPHHNRFTALFPRPPGWAGARREMSEMCCAWLAGNTGCKTTIVLWPFFRDHLGELVPEQNCWTLWFKGRLTEADTLTIWLGATPSRLTSVYLHHRHIF